MNINVKERGGERGRERERVRERERGEGERMHGERQGVSNKDFER